MLPWAIADGVRYLFYLSHNHIIGVLRYNLFIVLYVIGVFLGEEVLMLQSPNNYLPIDKQNVLFFYFTKFWMFSTMLGFVVLYRYMFSARAEFYRKLNNKKDESDKPAETKDSTHNEKVKKEQWGSKKNIMWEFGTNDEI